jgi:alginate O-acetyltransferase complex protein AlgI
MLFTEPTFLFLFLPVVLGIYFCLKVSLRNAWLLVASLMFYYVGEQEWVLVMVGSIAFNYVMGLSFLLFEREAWRRMLLTVGVMGNLAPLAYFKYAGFAVSTLHDALGVTVAGGHLSPHLPLGISFYTFHGLSYMIDVYRRTFRPLRKPEDFALYIVLFPQLIAGPIIRYSKIAAQFSERRVTSARFADGVRRFTLGLGKKMIIANTVAVRADQAFGCRPEELDASTAWIGAICYMVQIYFDFSGYTDMAIGLGKMFGFEFPENFNYPYAATSVTDFWRRWHMTLSSWFRDYVYIPMGGNRVRPWRVYLNLLTVFFLCGLWHGASWTFVVWGLYHGMFLVLERVGEKRLGWEVPMVVRRGYLLGVVLVGWVMFRADNAHLAGSMLEAMVGHSRHRSTYAPAVLLTPDVLVALGLALIGSADWTGVLARLRGGEGGVAGAGEAKAGAVWRAAAWGAEFGFLVVVLLTSLVLCVASTYNPFIYFRF